MPLADGEGGEMFEQQRGDAEALMSVVDHERRVGVVTTSPPFVARPAEQLAVRLDDERRPIDEVDVREVVELALAQRRLGGEVAAVPALLGLPFVEGRPAAVRRLV